MKYLTNILDIKIYFFSKYFIDKKKIIKNIKKRNT